MWHGELICSFSFFIIPQIIHSNVDGYLGWLQYGAFTKCTFRICTFIYLLICLDMKLLCDRGDTNFIGQILKTCFSIS